MDRVKREAYGDESYRRHEHDGPLKKVRSRRHDLNQHRHKSLTSATLPIAQESEPWRGSSGFGLANILNRSSSGSASNSAMPKFSLPSLHSFGKPLLTKPEVSMVPQNYEEENQYISTRHQHQQLSADSSPARQTSPSPNSRRIAPAPADEEEADQEAENTATSTRGGNINQPIRGGRWTADEHERFLEGFRIHGHKWKRVQQVVRTRSVTQVRTHAQKYLLKVAKLKAEKKQSGKVPEMATLAAETHSGSTAGDSVDGSNTAPSTPEHGAVQDSPRKTPRKKVRRLDPGNCDPVDQEYIAAAATTLCFLMSQKIDSLFDTRHEPQTEDKSDYEPYDCYAPQTARQPDTDRSGSRKRSYMHFITDQQDDYSSSHDTAPHGEPSSYTIEGSKLCS
ncbi:hypothetical protein F444_11503 [Phytophthora nicotianae P1976]|uniref:Uncharacterized protein n=1 Tax=Phytophthora nicotianae P1976 TaxID=1317066 RepID=A0A081A0H2_PHYNI|nr:hypothetical protein F444_11503 [Phytophthora nicotianae P1976]